MAIDHSLTYRQLRIRNVPHMLRLRKIRQVVLNHCGISNASYADVGCSNGYITNIVSGLISAKATKGFDHSDNLTEAQQAYPSYEFVYIDLNQVSDAREKFDLVTCFETLEHVGAVEVALDNLLNMTERNGKLILSVPIEIGAWGILKYFVKRLVYRYELPLKCKDQTYLAALVKGDDISQFRYPSEGYESHFGFDYRIIDRHLGSNSTISGVKAWDSFTTRFYVIDI